MNHTALILDLLGFLIFITLHLGIFSGMWKTIENSKYSDRKNLIDTVLCFTLLTSFTIIPELVLGDYSWPSMITVLLVSIIYLLGNVIFCGTDESEPMIIFFYCIGIALFLISAHIATIPEDPKLDGPTTELVIIPQHSYAVSTPNYNRYLHPSQFSFAYKKDCYDKVSNGGRFNSIVLENGLAVVNPETNFTWNVESRIDDSYVGTAEFNMRDSSGDRIQNCQVHITLSEEEVKNLVRGGTTFTNLGN